jgi:glycosyltransferase involved in cell wall biosynthesis
MQVAVKKSSNSLHDLERKRSILMIGNFLSQSVGTRQVCEDLAVRLQTAGWNVLSVSRHPQPHRRIWDMIFTAWSKRQQYEVAQVDVYSGRAFLWAEAVTKTLGILKKPFVLTLHGGNLPIFAKNWHRRVRNVLEHASAVTVPSPYLLNSLSSFGKDLVLLPNPIDLHAYNFTERQKPSPKLIWLRSFHSVYNPLLAPKVLSRLESNFPGTTLVMGGPDKEDGTLEATRAEARALGIADRINFPGRISKQEIPEWLQRGDIFLNTTNVDNTPVSVLEAMACGLCVVSTNVGGIPYLLEHDREALLVPPDNPEAMAAAVRRILTEPGLGPRLSRNARAKAERFDWNVILPQWEELLRTVVSFG